MVGAEKKDGIIDRMWIKYSYKEVAMQISIYR